MTAGAALFRRLGAPGLLLLLTLACFWPLLGGGEALYWGTPLLQFAPWRGLAAASYLGGQLPLWNPYSGYGAPLAANLQSAAFYPLNVVYLVLPVERAMTATVVLHVALAGWFTHGFARALGRTTGGALLSAVTFMLSGYIVARAGFLSMTAAVPWLPALLWGIVAATAPGNAPRLRPLVGVAAATGMLLLAGHMQLAFYILLAAGGYAVVRCWAGGAPAGTVGRLATLAAAGALGVVLAGVQLIPALELTAVSIRHEGIAFDTAAAFSLWPGQLIGALIPGFFGTHAAGDWWGPGPFWEGVIYLGVLPLLLVPWALLRQRDATTWYLAALAALALFLALGRYNPFFEPLYRTVPGLGLFQAPARFTLLYGFAAAVLAGAGWDAARRHPAGTRRTGRLVAAAGLVLAGAAGGLSALGPPGLGAAPAAGATALAGVWLAAAGLALSVCPAAPGWWGPPVAVGLVVLDLLWTDLPLNPTTAAALYTAALPEAARRLRDDLAGARLYTTDAAYQAAVERFFNFRGPFVTRWDDLLTLRAWLTPNTGSAAGVFEAYNYDPIRVRRQWLLQRAAEAAGLPGPVLDAMHVGATATPDPAGGVRITPRTPGLARAYVAPTARPVTDFEAAVAAMLAHDFDPGRAPVVELPAGTVPPAGRGGRAAIIAYGPHKVAVATESEGGVLVLSDTYYPGWTARVDGRPAAVWPANAAFRAVALPAGARRVEFTYEPASVAAGLATSGTALVVLAGLAGFAWRRRARPGERTSP